MDGWVVVSRGPLWQMQLEAGRLQDEGIGTLLPDETIKTLDPFATGALPLHTNLHVRTDDAPRAQALLAQLEEEGIAPEAVTAAALATPPDPSLGISPVDAAADDGEADDTPEAAALQERLETLARRTRWGALLVWLAPFAIYFGFTYLALSHRTGRRDAKHGLTLTALGLGIFLVVCFLFFFGIIGPLDDYLWDGWEGR